MRYQSARARLFFSCAAAVLAAHAGAAITINAPTNHVATANITGFTNPWTGTVTLAPDPVIRLAPPAGGGVFMTTFAADIAQYPGWTAISGANLNGTVQLDTYEARDLADRTGGAAMEAAYTPAVGENLNGDLRWVQMFDSTNSGRHIDPFPNDDNRPMYYTEAEHNLLGMHFEDFPEIGPIPDMAPFSFAATFEVYLCTVNIPAKTMYVHDGWKWGYNVEVVPAPGAIGLASLAGLIAARRRRT